MTTFIRWFDEITLNDIPLVGGKTASLGEMVQSLGSLGVKVPNGFAITAPAYWAVLGRADTRKRLEEVLRGIDKRDVADLARRGRIARQLVRDAGIPEDLWREIQHAYERLSADYGQFEEGLSVAVRSSATAEDLPTASFAGQQETYLNVRGYSALREAISLCFASLFTDRAISYRLDNGFDHFQVALSIAVQKMVRSDLGASGVMFTLDTESCFRDLVMIEGAWGLGENVVQGTVDPDEFCVFKPTLKQGKRPILRKRLGTKALRMVYAEGAAGQRTRNEPVSERDRRRFCITDDDVLTLARFAVIIEEHYSKKAGEPRPMDVEWAKDGESDEIFIVQARPETVQSQRKHLDVLETYVLEEKGEILATGKSVGAKIGQGKARVVRDIEHLEELLPGEVLIAETTTPDWEPVMKRAAAVVTDRGGRTCHAAIVARELGIAAVVGTGDGTQRIASGKEITVSCAGGDSGRVYAGKLAYRVDEVSVQNLGRPRTNIQMNVGDPEQAFRLSFLPNDGVGLARMEFIISNFIKVHPMALLHPERLDEATRVEVARITAEWSDKPAFFVDRLAQGIGTIAAAFYPKPVIVRLSDFKSNEYARLVGGAPFEAKEENPMLGLRGAARYTHPTYEEAFVLECRALAKVRGEMGLDNVKVMVPFCRRVEEGERALEAMAKHGLTRGKDGLEVYVMCEIPNNVIRIDEFCRIFDGISIGSNDLTQLTLGVDRDSALVAFDFDERDPGVLEMMRLAVEGARRNGRHAGICGQAPSDYPEIAEFLVRLRIEALSLNPDTVLATTRRVLELERRIEAGGAEDPPAR